jgi:filamentous hemagglutinin
MSSPKSSRRTRRLGRAVLAASAALTTVFASAPRSSLLAGDILRGGGTSAPGRNASSDPGNSTAAATLPGGVNAHDSLSRTAEALQAVRAMQDAAHAAASHSSASLGPNPLLPGKNLPKVPNGLVSGGLQLAPGVPANLAHPTATENPLLWTGAKLPTQSAAGGQTDVDIVQTSQQALLNWQTFNIGKETTVTFDQTAGGAEATQWIAFNKINDPSGVPSQILGSLKAVGQVYLINSNGIIFGGSSQINLHSLVASAVPINDNLVSSGLLDNPDNQFLFSALPLPSGANGTPAFNPAPSNTPDGRYGDVTVQAGATLTSPTSAENVGGRITLIGANVSNDGTISTPDGQTILAAGLQVGFAAHSSSDPSLRGLDTYVGNTSPYGGSATNNGLIEAPRADVTLAGSRVNQLGFINCTTSVAENGRIDLQANYDAVSNTNTQQTDPPPFLFQATGQVTLGPNSVTEVVPEYGSTQRVVGATLALPSQVNIQGLEIHEDANALLFAPSGNVSLTAGTWVFYEPDNTSLSAESQFVSSVGQVYLDPNAVIDVSGSKNISAPVSENVVAAQLLGPELANSPLQRNGPLRGQTIYVDISDTGTYDGQPWVGTPLADVSGYVNLVQRTVGELTTGGGSVSLSAGSSVVLQKGSLINVSGGWINYAGGMVPTTQVMSGGNIFDISQATPDRVYQGIVGGFTVAYPQYGIVETSSNPLSSNLRYDAGYTQGASGGSLQITAPSMALDGQLLARTMTGVRQAAAPPAPSSLALTFQAQNPTPETSFSTFSPTPPDVTFANVTQNPVGPFALDDVSMPLPLADNRKKHVFLSPELVSTDGFGKLTVDDSDGNITVPQSAALKTKPGGAVSLSAANLFVNGSITAPGGSITLDVFDISPTVAAALKLTPGQPTPAVDPTRGGFELGSTARLDTAGNVTDLRSGASDTPGASYLAAGGQIAISSFSMDLHRGSVISANGGLTVSGAGQVTYGAGGSISLAAGQDINLLAVFGGVFNGRLKLGATLSGLSGASGGSLSILAPFVQVGGQASHAGTLLLSPDFFSEGGFANFTLTGLGDTTGQTDIYLPAVVIAPGTQINPVAQSLVAHLDTPGQGGVTLTSATLPEGLRNPVSLNFRAPGIRDLSGSTLPVVRGDFVMGDGASIETDGLGSVTISANTAEILGAIDAPGGTISVAGGSNSGSLFSDDSQALFTVDLGSSAVLSTAGQRLLIPNSLGLRSGSVLAGGSITLSGNVAARAGSLLDVSGASGVLDLPPGYSVDESNGSLHGAAYIPTRLNSDGGSIVLNGGQELFVDSTLRGAPGGPSATGGALTVSSQLFFAPGSPVAPSPLNPTLQVTQSGDSIPAALAAGPFSLIGSAIAGDQTTPGHFAADQFNNSGLASLNLEGSVQFNGPVTLNAARSLAVGNGGVIFSDVSVSLNAPYVSLGTAFSGPLSAQEPTNAFTVGGQPFYFPPVNGAASLSVSASLIDIGNLSLQGIGNANLVANGGDIRGDGTLDIAGNLQITAGQIYPPSETTFTIAAYDYTVRGATHAGTITLAGSGTRPLPLSAGGTVNLLATRIKDGGVVRAPIGTINLGSDGTGAPFVDPITDQNGPSTSQVELLAGSVSSVSAVDPTTGKSLLIPYGVSPDGKSWIDPAGNDITVTGIPAKDVNVAGQIVGDQTGSHIDIRGGGDLYAYQFQSGTGGTNDILNATTSFAVLPGNDPGYAPFVSSTGEANAGYSNSTLTVGDQIHLRGSAGLPGGTYTLLPARYALLPGAFLVTPVSNAPTLSAIEPTGATIVSGYRFNGFDPLPAVPLLSSFEVAPASVVSSRALYIGYSANTFLKEAAIDNDEAPPRLPIDSGRLLFVATQQMEIDGSLAAQAPAGGRGGEVDISSPTDIRIIGPSEAADPGDLNLEAASLSSFGAESLLIGGQRSTSAAGTVVTATTANITVDDAGSALTGPDVILVASQSITLAPSAVISQAGTLSGSAEALIIGNEDTAGSGNGVLIRVSGDPSATVVRLGVSGGSTVSENIGAHAVLAGASVTLDSTAATSLDPSASLRAQSLNLNSGQINIDLGQTSSPPPSLGLVLSGNSRQP